MPEPQYKGPPRDVTMIRAGISKFMRTLDDAGKRIGSSKYGIYAFYDYDGEPIYVGQTRESLSQRVARHLTNQRTDAAAMNVLDPFEVADIEVWPMQIDNPADAKDSLNKAEYTVFCKLLAESKFGAILNEVIPPETDLIELPKSYRARIISDEVFRDRKHPDIRLARRALTIANLAKVISERKVKAGLRVTLHVQARRLEDLARERLKSLGIEHAPVGTDYEDETED